MAVHRPLNCNILEVQCSPPAPDSAIAPHSLLRLPTGHGTRYFTVWDCSIVSGTYCSQNYASIIRPNLSFSCIILNANQRTIIITGEAVERGYLLPSLPQTDHSQLLRLFQFTQLPIYEQILDTTQTQYTAANFSFRSALALRLLKMNGSASGFDQNPVIISVALMTTFSNLVQNRSLP